MISLAFNWSHMSVLHIMKRIELYDVTPNENSFSAMLTLTVQRTT